MLYCKRRSAHTHEEAQAFVHDLNQFVTVQLLEETHAVLTRGKLCKDHGYSCGSAVKIHDWPKMGKTLSARHTILYLVSFQGYLTSLEAFRLLQMPSQESLGPEAPLAYGNRAAASSSSDSVLEQSDELATRKLGQESLRSDKKDENDPLADMPFWSKDFTDNLIPAEVRAPAHISQDSDSEHSTRVATKSRKHSIFTHFPKDRNCDVCLRTQITKASCRRRTGEALPRTEKFGDLITADHKVLDEGCESGDDHRYAIVVSHSMDSILSVQNKIFTWDGKNFLKFLESSQAPKVVYTDNSMEFGKACEGFVMESRHVNTSSIRDKWHRWKIRPTSKGRYVSSIATVRTGWKVVVRFYGCHCYLRNVQDLLADAKTPYERRFGEPFKGPIIPFGAMVDHHPSSPKDQSRIHQFGKKVPPGILLGYELIAGWIWKGDILVADLEDLETLDASDIYPRRIKANEVLISQEDDEFIFPIADGTAKLSKRDYDFRAPTLRREQLVRSEWRSQWRNSRRIGRVSTIRTNRWRWSPWRSLVDSRWLHLSSTHWTTSTKHSYATELHWCYQVYSYWSGCTSGKEDWRLLECRVKQASVRLLERIHEIHSTKRETSKRIHVVRGEIDKDSDDHTDQIMQVRTFGRKLVKLLRIEKNKNGRKKNQGLTMLERWGEFTLSIQMIKEHSEILKNARKEVERPMAPAMPCKRDQQHPSIVKTNAEPKTGNESEFKTVYGCTVESHESTRQRAESLQSKTHEDRIAGEGFTSMAHYNLVHKFIPLPQAMKIPDAKAAVDKEWKNARDNSSLGLGKSQEQRGGYSGSTKRQKESTLCFTDGHMSPQKMRSWNQSFRSTKAASCSVWTL